MTNEPSRARASSGLRVRANFLAIVCFAAGSSVYAMPTISITAPTPGAPLYDLRPTITVTYSTDAAPLRLDTLQVLVNGVDWTGRFSIGPDSASYDVSEADTLAAGILTIGASISDEVAGRASADRTYEVFPTFVKLEPNLGVEGEEITVTGLGLDPSAANNVHVFSAIFQPGTVEAPFSSVEPSRETGRVAAPRGTITGPSFLKVNGKRSRESLTFTVPRTIPACGDVRSAQYLVDGSLIVHYFGYLSSVPHDPAWESLL